MVLLQFLWLVIDTSLFVKCRLYCFITLIYILYTLEVTEFPLILFYLQCIVVIGPENHT